jgi:hypothetical protein
MAFTNADVIRQGCAPQAAPSIKSCDESLCGKEVGPIKWVAYSHGLELLYSATDFCGEARKPEVIEMSEQYATQLDAKFLRLHREDRHRRV